MAKQRYFSVAQSFQAGKTLKFPPWVPAEGPTGRRNYLLGLLLLADYDITVAGAVIQGEDMPRIFANIRVSTIGGPRWDLPGDASRVMASALVGPARMHESADIPIAANNIGRYALWIPFAKPFGRRKYDFAVAADVLKEVEIQCPAATGLDIGASDATINSVTYSIMAVCRELDAVEVPSFDVVGSTVMESATQGTIHVNGGHLAEVIAHKTGASGGTALTGWTSHYLPNVAPEPVTAEDMKLLYGLSRAAARNGATPGATLYNDPVLTNQARLVHFLDGDDKLIDHPFVPQSAVIKATNTEAGVVLLHRAIYPTPPNEEARVRQAYGTSRERVKTEGKTRRDPRAWGARANFLPKSLE